MISGLTADLDATAVLAAARRFRQEANAAEAGVLAQAVEWARLHKVDELDDAATWWAGRGQDTGIPIAGDGAPLVSEFAVLEFATALGLSADSGRMLMAQALELAHRLPRVWARVQGGSLAPWRARRIAEQTLVLSPEAVAFVDAQVAPFAHKTGPAQTQRLVETAIARHMPDHAAAERERAAEQRHFTIDHDQVSFAGTSRVHGELDLSDALDLEDAVRRGAEQLAALGNSESLDVRRSLAVGMLARGQHAIEFEAADGVVSAGSTTQHAGSTTQGAGSTTQNAGSSTPGRRDVVLYVHLSEAALRTGDRNAPAWLENAGGHLVTAGQVADWCRGSAGSTTATKVTVKPVIDLHDTLVTDAYQVPDRIAEHVRLRDRTCVFPWCQRPARSCDLDHVAPYVEHGPPGQTSTLNLAPLCRRHHRLKTHGGWTYTMVEPGTYLWHSPHGYSWLRDHAGTTDLSPPPVEPPER